MHLTQPPSGMLRDVHPNPDNVRWGRGGGTAVLGDGVRVFEQFVWLRVGSVKAAFSRPGRAPGWCPIPPMLRNTPKGHNADRWATSLMNKK
jgi:hypothetical protein